MRVCSNIPPIYIDVFERKMREVCEVKHSYGDATHADDLHRQDSAAQQPYSVEEVDDEDEDGSEGEGSVEEGAKEKTGAHDKKVVVDRTDVKITSDDGESWQVTNEVVTFSSNAEGAIVPYKPFDAVRQQCSEQLLKPHLRVPPLS